MELKGSQTEKNLQAAFDAEAKAMTRYYLYAGIARRDGYEQMAGIFEETAHNEQEHAELWMKHLQGGTLSDTQTALEAAAAGELFEHQELYPGFAEVAAEEGFSELAKLFQQVAEIEREHEERYRKLLEHMKNGMVFSREGDMIWRCRNCGHIYAGKDAPLTCPVCGHPQAYFELRQDLL